MKAIMKQQQFSFYATLTIIILVAIIYLTSVCVFLYPELKLAAIYVFFGIMSLCTALFYCIRNMLICHNEINYAKKLYNASLKL
jgi:hypothetical protein